MVAYTVEDVPRWNPINICSYHLQEAGATPVQEIAYAMANAIAVLDAVRERVDDGAAWARSSGASPSSSTPACASSRSTPSCARWAILWEELGRERYGVQDPKHLRFRYGVQVNSLGLTESQPENNVQRIVLEALAVTLGPRRPRTRHPAAGVERGARPAAPVGPAVVAAHPAGARLRDRPARVPRPLRGLERHGRAGRRAARGRAGRDGDRRRARRRGRRRGLHEVGRWSTPTASASAASSPASRSSSASTASPSPSPRRCWRAATAGS